LNSAAALNYAVRWAT